MTRLNALLLISMFLVLNTMGNAAIKVDSSATLTGVVAPSPSTKPDVTAPRFHLPPNYDKDNPMWTTRMVVTAYTNGPESTGKSPGHPAYGITKSGATAGPGTIAADTDVPFGTILWIDGYGYGIVEDRGGAIKGNRLDVWIYDVQDARQWGVQTRDVRVLRWGR